jgi:hypothetical protein
MSFEQWKMGDKHEAMITLSDCADLLERGNIFDSVEVYKMLISWACDLGRYFDAGRVRHSLRLRIMHPFQSFYLPPVVSPRGAGLSIHMQ